MRLVDEEPGELRELRRAEPLEIALVRGLQEVLACVGIAQVHVTAEKLVILYLRGGNQPDLPILWTIRCAPVQCWAWGVAHVAAVGEMDAGRLVEDLFLLNQSNLSFEVNCLRPVR